MLLNYMVTQCHSLPLDKNNFDRNICLKETLKTPDNSNIGFFRS